MLDRDPNRREPQQLDARQIKKDLSFLAWAIPKAGFLAGAATGFAVTSEASGGIATVDALGLAILSGLAVGSLTYFLGRRIVGR